MSGEIQGTKVAQPDARGTILLGVARGVLVADLETRSEPAPPKVAWIEEPGAVFVTLRIDGALRGCVGSLEAHRPLIDDVRLNTRGAAFRDPRFAPLVREELPSVAIEISELSTPMPLVVAGESEALAALEPGRDGVILAFGDRRATFLPQVWDSLPAPRNFLGELKKKAGLPSTFWDRDIRLWRYTVRKWR